MAGIVWDAFGDVANYVEPFFGSGAVLLGRPHAPKIETVNDRDCFLANFWRALKSSPEDVARFADWPVNEAEIEARHRWLVSNWDRENVMRDPEYFDAKAAGWWVYGLCGWIGSGWCQIRQPAAPAPGERGPGGTSDLPYLGTGGQGVHRQLPHLGDAGQGVHRKLPKLDNGGSGVNAAGRIGGLVEYFCALADRMRGVRVACGDWSRVVGDSVTWRHGTTGVFLDPPYDDGEIDYAAGGRGVAAEVAEWCRENGNDPRLRIALCGYEGDHDMPGWTVQKWKAHGGFSSQRSGDPNGNPHRERIWFSPHCVRGSLSEPLLARLTGGAA